MKLIIAIIRLENLETVQAALHEREACLISVSQVLGGGREPGRRGIYRGTEFRVRRPKLRLEISAGDWGVEAAVEAILRAGATDDSGQIGDCKVLVMHLDECDASVMADEDRWPSPPEVEDLWRLR